MSEYQLEIKQIVDYPRCRIYRQFIRTLMEDRSIRASGGSGLFHYAVLCSYANFRTSYRRPDGVNYTIYPGEWVCRLSELRGWFQVHFQYQATAILDKLQKQHLITYSVLGRGNIIKFRIKGWRRHNTVLEYNAPCQKDSGFFFIPVATATDIISMGKCSEMDCLLDLWINTVYNDGQVQGSEVGPVVYMRNGTGNPLVAYSELAERWGLSKATVGRFLKRLKELGHISLMTFPGNKGSAIYLQSYLSTMFQISDILVDKEEVAMALSIKISPPEGQPADAEPDTKPSQACGSKKGFRVSKTHMDFIVQKIAQILAAQGISCLSCPKSQCKLYPLSDDCMGIVQGAASSARSCFLLCVSCGNAEVFRFELKLTPSYQQLQEEK